MLSNYIEQLFKLDNYYDGLIVTDNKGYIEFFMTYRPDISGAKQEDLVGKHVLDIYPGLTEETSTIMRVLRSGEPIYNEYQTLITCREEVFQSVNTTMPIRAGGTGEIIGAIDVSRYASRFYEKQSINLHFAHTRKGPFYCVDDIITCSEDMEAIKRKIPLISKTDSTVLITGRSGTGKELIAQSIHTSSNRADKAFVSQNCAAIPATLLESILFGTTKGSYTGAKDTPGLFELADGGTLFLDEINSMELTAQAKLLRVLEDNCIRRIGAKEEKQVNVRIIAAVNEDPEGCVERNKIREDIFYRLCVLRYDIPELYRRKGDIPLLMEYFRKHYNKKFHKQIMAYSSEVQDIFLAYNWPGNVRELKNVIESAFHNNHTAILTRNDIPNYILSRLAVDTMHAEDVRGLPLHEMLARYEVLLIEDAYRRNGGSLTKTAAELQVSKQNLAYKMKKYNIR